VSRLFAGRGTNTDAQLPGRRGGLGIGRRGEEALVWGTCGNEVCIYKGWLGGEGKDAAKET